MSTPLDKSLATLIADYHVFYQKLRGYHWTVRGPQFFVLHERFEALYRSAAEKGDAIAERMVARGQRPPTTLSEHLQNSGLKEDGQSRQAAEMVAQVAKDLRFLGDNLRSAARQADEEKDETTANLLDAFADGEEKERWMLEAFLAG